MKSDSILGSIPCGPLEYTPESEGTHWSATETDTIVPLNNSEIFTPRKVAKIEGEDEATVHVENPQITLNGRDPESMMLKPHENSLQFKEPASYDDIFETLEKVCISFLTLEIREKARSCY